MEQTAIFVLFAGILKGCLGLYMPHDDDSSKSDSEVSADNSKTLLINNYLQKFLLAQRKINNELSDYKDYDSDSHYMKSFKWEDDYRTTNRPLDSDDSWSIVWYIVSFSGLIVFFLLVSCSEWCCRKHVRMSIPTTTPPPQSSPQTTIQDPSPPAYDLFAPPSYDSLANKTQEKSEYDVYVVPVHAIGTVLNTQISESDEPPSYSAVNLSYVPESTETNLPTASPSSTK